MILDNLEEMFPRYYIHSDDTTVLRENTVQLCALGTVSSSFLFIHISQSTSEILYSNFL